MDKNGKALSFSVTLELRGWRSGDPCASLGGKHSEKLGDWGLLGHRQREYFSSGPPLPGQISCNLVGSGIGILISKDFHEHRDTRCSLAAGSSEKQS